MNCDHFWRTVELYGYGWISVCEHCGERESAEHTQECFDSAIYKDLPCICGAAGEFQKYEAGEETHMAETRDELIQRGKAELRGTWPEGCLQRAFVEGASWWQFVTAGATMWQSDRKLAEAEAVKMYGVPANRPRWKVTLEQETDGRWIAEVESVPGALAYGETKEEAAVKAVEIASFGSAASTDHAASLSGNSVMREDMPHQRGNTAGFILELIDILARPIQDGGEGMADNRDSPLMRLRAKITGTQKIAVRDAKIGQAYERVHEHARTKPHETVPVQVWADIDVGIADLVRYLNTIEGVRTDASCQGTEGYRPYVMATWNPKTDARLRAEFEIETLGEFWGYVREYKGACRK